MNNKHWTEYTTVGISFVALMVSVILPLWIRSCDHRELTLDVSIEIAYLHRLNPESESDLLSRIVNSWNINKVVYPASQQSAVAYLSWYCEHRLFRMRIVNKRASPCSLSHIGIAKLIVDYPNGDTNMIAGNLTLLKEETDIVELTPYINLGPSETKSVRIISSRVTCPSAKSVKSLFMFVPKEQNAEGIMLSGFDTTGTSSPTFVTRKAYDSEYLSKSKLVSFQIEAYAQSGQRFLSNEIQGESSLVW
jgi:hypothetical protein